jgi:hypothetical protein
VTLNEHGRHSQLQLQALNQYRIPDETGDLKMAPEQVKNIIQKPNIKILVAMTAIAAGIAYPLLTAWQHESFASSVIGSSTDAPNLATAPETMKAEVRSPATAPFDIAHFSTQPATGVFADGGGGYTSAQCAAALDPDSSSHMYNGHPINQETVPQNQQPHSPGSPADGVTSPVNQTKPTRSQLAYYASDGYVSSVMNAPYTWMKMVDGQYTGMTEMIIRWAACKWGMDEDMIRAQATTEHWTWIQWNAGGDERFSIHQCQSGNNPGHNSTDLWGYLVANACYQSWSLWQTKVVYSSPDSGAWTTWPAINESTAFAADYRFASQRSCLNGDQSGYFKAKGVGDTYLTDVRNAKNAPYSDSPHKFWNPVTGRYATNLEYVELACVGSHFSGGWMDPEARSYLQPFLNNWSKRAWLPK